MRVIRVVLLCLLVGITALYAKGFKVIKPEKVTAPVGFVEDATKRGRFSKVFKNQADTTRRVAIIGVEPIHYPDSLGVMREYDFNAAPDTSTGYTNAVQVGRFRVEYSPSGKVRYLRKKAMIQFTPAFDTTQVGVEFIIDQRGLKSNYTLDKTSPNRLVWGFDYSANFEKEGTKGKGRLKDAANIVRGEMQELVAWDANRTPVPLTVTFTDDSLIVVADTNGVEWPVVIDPSITDSSLIVRSASGALQQTTVTTWAAIRDSLNASEVDDMPLFPYMRHLGVLSTQPENIRFALTLLTGEQISASLMDSARLYFYTDGVAPYGDSAIVAVVKGTFTGSTLNKSWYNDFVGWAASSVYSVTRLDSTYLKFYPADGAGYKSTLLNRRGLDTLQAYLGVDTLRLMLLEIQDIARSAAIRADVQSLKSPYLAVFYQVGGPPGVTTLADLDTLKSNGNAIWFSVVGKVDSTGGTIDSVGVRYIKKGQTLTSGTVKKKAQADLTAADTFTVSLASADSLAKDTLYVYQIAAHSERGWSYSATYDTLSTYIGPAFIRTNPDPVVSAWPWMHATLNMTLDSCGKSLGNYAAAAEVGNDSLILFGYYYWLKGTSVVDSVYSHWISGPKWCSSTDLTKTTSTSDTLLTDTLYYFTAFVKGSLGPLTLASDSQAIAIDGVFVVGLSAPTYDLASVLVQFNAVIDSTGSVPAKPTTRGFFAWLREPNPVEEYSGTDTVTVSESSAGGYPYDLYSLSSTLATDTVYLWRSYAVNSAGTAYGNVDSVRTYLQGVTSSLVVGGTDTIYVNTGTTVRAVSTGRAPRKFEGRR